MPHKVLFVDDEPHVTDSLRRALRKEPYDVLSAHSADEALRVLARESVDVVVSDEKMPGMPGSEFLAMVCKLYPETIRIILTGQASMEAAIRAINQGEIYRFLTKPCNEADLAFTIRQALQLKDLMVISRRLWEKTKRQSSILQELEREHPGITRVKRDSTGAIIMDDDTDDDFDALIDQFEKQCYFSSTGKK
jgi:two-component system probable response regulator PhcQ